MKIFNITQNIFIFVIYIACIYLFIALMKDIWDKFNARITTTGIRYRGKDEELLPCITIHSFSAFKSKGFYYTEEDIRKNSLKVEDIFENETLLKITQNSSLYKMTEFYSIYFGTCFTVCYQKKVGQKEDVDFRILRNLKLKIYVHLSGDEDLFLIKLNLYYPKSFFLDTSQDSGTIKAEFSVSQFEYSISNFEKSCKEYSIELGYDTDISGFRDCALNALLSFFKSNLTCSITGFLSQKRLPNLMPQCSSFESATKSFEILSELTSKFANNPQQFGCPAVCNMSNLNVNLNLVHSNSVIDPLNKQKLDGNRNFVLSLFYQYMDVEEKTESLIYDSSTFLAAAGGNLGLALGFSCLSILLGIVNYVSKLLKGYFKQ